MAKLIEFEGNQLEFPDDATPEEISSVLNQQFPAPSQQPQAATAPGVLAPVRQEAPVAPAATPSEPQQSFTLGGQGRVVSPDPAPFAPAEAAPFTGDVENLLTERQGPTPGFLENLTDQFRLGIVDIGTGILQRGSELVDLIPGADTSDFRESLAASRQSLVDEAKPGKEAFPVSSFTSRIAGQVAGLPIPGVSQGSFAMRAGSNAAIGALAGFVQPTEDDADARTNAVVGALAGGGLSALGEPFSRLIRKTLNAEKGVFKKEQVGEIIRKADELGIPVFADDVMDSKFANFASQAAEEVPLAGTSSNRAKQAAAQKAAVESFMDGLAAGSNRLDGDVDTIILESLQGKISQRIGTKRQLWNKAAQALPGNVPLDNYRAATAQQFQKHLLDNTDMTPEQTQQLMFQLLDDASAPQAMAALQQMGKTLDINVPLLQQFRRMLATPEKSFNVTYQEPKRKISQIVSNAYKGTNNAIIGDKEAALFQPIKEALDADLETFARGVGGDGLRKFERAKAFTAKLNADVKGPALSRLAKKDAAPEQIMNFLRTRGGEKSRNELLIRNLDSEGKQAVKFAIVNDAFRGSLDEQGNLLVDKFAKELLKSQGIAQSFFKGRDAKQMESLLQVLRATQGSARQFGSGQSTNVLGRRLLQSGTLTGATIGAGAVAGAGAIAAPVATVGLTAGAVRMLLQTKTGLRLMTAVGASTPGTAKHDAAVQAAIRFMTQATTGSFNEAN